MPDSNIAASLPVYVGPKPSRPELINDQHYVFLVDPDGTYIGFDTNWGRGGPLSRLVYAGRSTTRDL